MSASRLLARSLNQRSLLLRQLLSQKPLTQRRGLPLRETARWLATKDGKDVQDIKESGPMTIGPDGNVVKTPVTLKIIPVGPVPNLSYDDRNMLLGRQLSPHLSIYKTQLTSLLSICLRISGLVLAVFVWALGISGLCMEGDMESLVKKAEDCDCSCGVTALKVMVVAPFAYHAVAGTRHLIWLLNKFVTVPEVYATGYVALVLAVVLAAALLLMDVKQEPKEEVDLCNPDQQPPKEKHEKPMKKHSFCFLM